MSRRTRKNRRLRKTRRRRKQRRTRRRRTRRRRGGEIKKVHGLKKKFPGRIKELNRVWKESGGNETIGPAGCVKIIKKWNKLYRHTGRRIRHPSLYYKFRKCRQKYKTLDNKFFPFHKTIKKNQEKILRLRKEQRVKDYRKMVRYAQPIVTAEKN